jgi:hypothetical protein
MRPLNLLNSREEIAESGARWLCKSTAEEIAVEYRQSGRRILAVDGFMGSGKSSLAELLAAQLGCGALSLDDCLPEQQSNPSYVGQLDHPRIASAIEGFRADGEGIIEGICLRIVLQQHHVASEDVFYVYAASVAVQAEHVLWHEASIVDREKMPPQRLHREIVIYHREWRPHASAHVTVIRSDQNEMLEFWAPNGQQFSIRAALWKAAGIGLWVPPAKCYISAIPASAVELLSAIRPPVLSPETRGLDDSRLLDILTKIRRGTPLDPVKVYREPETDTIVLYDGAHRYFASVALCCTNIPCEYVHPPEWQ